MSEIKNSIQWNTFSSLGLKFPLRYHPNHFFKIVRETHKKNIVKLWNNLKKKSHCFPNSCQFPDDPVLYSIEHTENGIMVYTTGILCPYGLIEKRRKGRWNSGYGMLILLWNSITFIKQTHMWKRQLCK